MSVVKSFFILIVLTTFIPGCSTNQNRPGLDKYLTIKTKSGDFQRVDIELAITPQQMAIGLMHRTELKARSGMFFLFDDEREISFWMKDTLIPLDIIFITGEGIIHHIHPNAKPRDPTRIYSYGSVKAVLEINGGESAKLGLKIGDKVNHPLLENQFLKNKYQKTKFQ